MSASLPHASGVTTWPVASGAAVAVLPLPEDAGTAAAPASASAPVPAAPVASGSGPVRATAGPSSSSALAGSPSGDAAASRHPRESGDPATFAEGGAAADSTATANTTSAGTAAQPQPAAAASNNASHPVASPAIASTTASTATPHSFAAPRSDAGAVGGTVAALLLVVGLILLLAWFAKRMPGVAGANNPALRVVGSLSLGPRERVVVVDVGGTQLLLATGAGGTRALHTLSEPLPVAAPASSPFAQLLAQQVRRSVGMKPAGTQATGSTSA